MHLISNTGAYFPLTLKSLVVVRLYGYPWFWLFRRLIDVDRWLIDVDRCLVDVDKFFIVHQISILGHIPLSSMRFIQVAVREWMIDVGYLPHDFDIRSYTGAYFPIFFEYPWDWDNNQLGFRLCTSLWLPTVDDIRTSIHGFVKIETDHIRFHSRSVDGSFSQMLMRYIAFLIVTLQIGLSRWAVCALWDLLLDESRCTYDRIYLLRFVDRIAFET